MENYNQHFCWSELNQGYTYQLNDRFHRLDGPAIYWGDGETKWMEWWIEGKMYTYKKYMRKLRTIVSKEDYLVMLLKCGDSP